MTEEISKAIRFKKFVKHLWRRIYWMPIQAAALLFLFFIQVVLTVILFSHALISSKGKKGWYKAYKYSVTPHYDRR